MPDLTADELLFSFPHDIWREIGRYLEPDEIEKLKLVCKSLKTTLTHPQLDSLWMPFLNRLHAIDPTISVNVPKGQIRLAFIAGASKINADQMSEIEYFHEGLEFILENIKSGWPLAVSAKSIDLVQKKLQETTYPKKATSVKELELRDHVLNDINAQLMKLFIVERRQKDPVTASYSFNLYGNDFCFTRLPSLIFLDPDLKNFWQNLEVLQCSRQKLRFISKEIKICQQLKTLCVNDNALEWIPEEIAECTKLTYLDFSENDLTSLPKKIENLTNLKKLVCHQNFLQQLPEGLKKKLGDQWAEQTLSDQGEVIPSTANSFGYHPLSDVSNNNNQENEAHTDTQKKTDTKELISEEDKSKKRKRP